MSAIAVAPRTVAAPGGVWPLARVEALRYLRHPLFLVGFVLGLAASAGEWGPIELDYHVIPSFFIGVFGIVVAARLTTSADRSRAVVDAAPVSETTRTAALCVACAVPGLAGLTMILLHRAVVLSDPITNGLYGTYGSLDRLVITVLVPLIACVGGPLLGVAVGRWLRFPLAELLTVVVVIIWSNVSGYVPGDDHSVSWFGRLVHVAAPYTAFAQGNGDGERPTTVVTSYTGAPTWFAVWTLGLCGLAMTAALWRGATGQVRSMVGRAFIVITCCTLLALTLSIVTGNQHWFTTVVRHG